jgi:glyoxylase-like metal-dependent hydrolase (beta-lactamase superfamily II)
MMVIGLAAGAGSFRHVHDVAATHGQAGWLAWDDAVVLELMSIASGLASTMRPQIEVFLPFDLVSGSIVSIHSVVIDVHLPAGVAGPEAMDFDVRCFLVPHASGLVLVDTGLPGPAQAIGTALAEFGAAWSDLTDVLLSHDHPDHVGALTDVLTLAPAATVWGNAPPSARALKDGDRIQGLQVIATPGHTAGHVSLLHDSGALLVGDLVGGAGDRLVRAPASFTADPEEAERSLRRIADIRADRLLPAHGAEVSHPFQALAELMDQNPTNGTKPE